MPSTFTVEVNLNAMIEPNQGRPTEGYRGDADTPCAHLHKCNFPGAPLTQGDQAHHSGIHVKWSRWPHQQRARFSYTRKTSRQEELLPKKHKKYKTPIQRWNCVGQAENHTHSKLFCLAAAENHMLAYHKETLYHSINIGTALIVNRIISI